MEREKDICVEGKRGATMDGGEEKKKRQVEQMLERYRHLSRGRKGM